MKRIILFSSLFALFTLHAADMSGDFNTWLGYIAGINADGDRTTVQGAGAGGEATGLIRTDLIGAAAGAYSSNLTDCVGIGYRALRNASDMREVVAIGSGAFSNRTGLTRATYINGQFVAYGQNNTFAVKANRNTPDTNAPIYYADGVLNLNADEIRFNGATASTGGTTGSTSAPSLAGVDLYVDCVNGDDSNAGTTPGTAKRTIDGAYAAVTNHDMTICLMPGIHLAPTNIVGGQVGMADDYPEYRIHLIAPYGKGKTIIDGEGARGLWGCSYPFASVEGCTIRNTKVRRANRPVFFAVYFVDCDFDTSNNPIEGSSRNCLFMYCVLERCTVRGGISATFSSGSGGDPGISSGVFESCDAFDTVFDLASTGTCYTAFRNSYFENCFYSIGKVRRFNSATESSVLGNASGFRDSTIICPGDFLDVPILPAVGCLFGLGTTNSVPVYSSIESSVCTNAATVAALIQSDYRPAVGDWRHRFVGYESAAERAVRDSMENSIVDALLKNENLNIAPAARASLLSLVVENEAEAAPVVVNRGTNSIPAGTVFRFHPDDDESPAID